MMMSGSCRRKERSEAAKVSPISSLICTWLIPAKLNSTGSSHVEMLSLVLFRSDRAEYRVVVFPDPVGPVDRLREILQLVLLEPQLAHVELQGGLVQEAQDGLFPVDRGQDGDAEIHLPPLPDLQLDPAILRQPTLRNIERGKDLDPRADGVARLQRGTHHLVEHAVDAVPYAKLLLVRLDVNIRSPSLDRVRQDEV